MVITEDNELLFSVLFERDFSPQDAETLLGFKPNNGNACVRFRHMRFQPP